MRIGLAPNFSNYADLGRARAADRGEQVEPVTAAGDRDSWNEHVTLSEMAEPLGFDSLWTYEHHNTPYMMMPNPLQFFAYMAGRTTKIDFGTVIAVLPWHNPIRLAEDVALLQHQLGPQRKFVLGVGRGLARREFESMGVDISESGGRFNECLDVLRLAFTHETFSYDGEHFKYSDASVRPRPLDPSVGHDAYAVVFATEASNLALANQGFNPMAEAADSLEDYSKSLTSYSGLRDRSGHGPANPPVWQTYLYCCESGQEADNDAERFYREHHEFGHWHFEIGGDRPVSTKGDDPVVAEIAVMLNDPSRIKALDEKMTRVFAEDAIVGTPEQCIEQIARANELILPSEIVLVPRFGSMSGEEAKRSVKLFAERALPTVQKMTNANITVPA